MKPRPSTDRNHDRYRVAACADVTGSDLLLYHRIQNLSEGGMCYAAANPDDVGTEIDVVLTFPRTEAEVPVKGEVVWVADDECERLVGLHWVDLSATERETLTEHISAAKTAVVSPGDLR